MVPADHLVRQIDAVLDLNWVHNELAPFYSHTGRPSIDPVLMIRLLIVGYVFAIRSERRLCGEVQVNLARTGASASSVSRTRSPIIRRSAARVASVSARAMPCVMCLSGW